MANTLKYLVLALALGCGSSSSGNNQHNTPSPDMNSVYDSSSGRDNTQDSGRHPYDSGLEGRLDGGLSDAGNGANGAPTLRMVYEGSHPLAGETYNERTVRRMRDTPFVAEVSDPDGDDVESRFEFGDGYTRSWDAAPAVIHAFGSTGNYTLVARVRDSRGMEGELSTIDLYVMNNIPPVANAGPDFELSTFVPACVVFGPCPAHSCSDGPYAPGHPSLDSYDEDGEMTEYEIYPNYEEFPESRYPNSCAGLTYFDAGIYTLRLRIVDDEGAQDHDDAVVNVE